MCQTNVFETREDERNGLKVKVELILDYHDDLSYMGHFSDKWQPGAINHKRLNPSRHCFKWFIPTPGCGEWVEEYEKTRAYFTRSGYSRHEAHTRADQMRFQDYKLIMDLDKGNAYLFGIVATVMEPESLIELGSSSCWGYWWTSPDDQEQIEADIEDHILEALAQVPDRANLITESIQPYKAG